MKRILTVFLCLCLALLGGALESAAAGTAPLSDFNYTWTPGPRGYLVTIKGYREDNDNHNPIVVIPPSGKVNSVDSTVTTIGSGNMEGGFKEDDTIYEVTIPEGVTKISAYAFFSCANLTTVSIPSTVTLVETYAFDRCINLTTIYFHGTESKWETVAQSNWNHFSEQVQVVFITPQSDFEFTVSNREATITGYKGGGGSVVIPSSDGGRRRIPGDGHRDQRVQELHEPDECGDSFRRDIHRGLRVQRLHRPDERDDSFLGGEHRERSVRRLHQPDRGRV